MIIRTNAVDESGGWKSRARVNIHILQIRIKGCYHFLFIAYIDLDPVIICVPTISAYIHL